jgi:hypothetical protein
LIQRNPVKAVIGGGGLLLLAGLPVFAMRLAVSDEGNDPSARPPELPTIAWPKGSGPASTARC